MSTRKICHLYFIQQKKLLLIGKSDIKFQLFSRLEKKNYPQELHANIQQHCIRVHNLSHSNEQINLQTCCANSLVGANTSAWQFFRDTSICSRIAIEKVAVFPVPD